MVKKSSLPFRSDATQHLRLECIPQEVFILSHSEAAKKIQEKRTGEVPWRGREVLVVSGNGPLHGLRAIVFDVLIFQDTNLGLKLTIESTLQGQCAAHHQVIPLSYYVHP